MFRDLKISFKLMIIQGVTAFTAVAICTAIFVFNAIDNFKQSSINNKYSIAQVIGENAAPTIVFNDTESAQKLLSNLSTNGSILNASLLDSKGKLFADYDKKGYESFDFPDLSGTDTLQYELEPDNRYVISYDIKQDSETIGTVLIRSEFLFLREIIKADIKAGVMIAFLALIASVIISFFLQRFISTRIKSLVEKTKEVTQTGDYSTRVPVGSGDEVGMLSLEFNNMLEQIEKRDNELEQRVEERTAELEASNKELESFSYSVSHDMRAPVRAITGYSHILSKRYISQFDELGREALNMIDAEAKRMGQLIDDLLEFSRLGKKEIEKSKVDMKELAEISRDEALKATEHKESTEVIIQNMPRAWCDKSLMRQVWVNLISNAIKYSQQEEHPKIEIGFSNGFYYVRDNGVGFDMEYYDKLFGVFQRLHTNEEFKGTGIGLAIVHRIVTRCGGSIWAESEVNKGATFHFST